MTSFNFIIGSGVDPQPDQIGHNQGDVIRWEISKEKSQRVINGGFITVRHEIAHLPMCTQIAQLNLTKVLKEKHTKRINGKISKNFNNNGCVLFWCRKACCLFKRRLS